MAAAKKKTELGSVTQIVEALTDHDAPAQDRILASALALSGERCRRGQRAEIGSPRGIRRRTSRASPRPRRIKAERAYRVVNREEARPTRSESSCSPITVTNTKTMPVSVARNLEPYSHKRTWESPETTTTAISPRLSTRAGFTSPVTKSYITTSGIEVVEKGFGGRARCTPVAARRRARPKEPVEEEGRGQRRR